jgi:hypothetical protein
LVVRITLGEQDAARPEFTRKLAELAERRRLALAAEGA